MHISKLLKHCLVVPFLFFLAPDSSAQESRGNDTSYYVYFPGSITTRAFVSKKYTFLTLESKSGEDLRYRPNNSLAAGIGVTYHNLSVNIAVAPGFFNSKNDNRGKTKYLDFQSHFYKPKWITDFYGQIYKGYHLYPEGFAASPGNDYYYRPDLRVTIFGVATYRVFNPKRFSYRAVLLQNEWQKKSAGSFLLGVEAYYGAIKADSSFVPKSVEANFTQQGINKLNYISIGPGAGYGYTLVVAKHLFLTGSFTSNLNFTYATEHSTLSKEQQLSVNPLVRFLVAAGYNSRTWNLTANWLGTMQPFKGNIKDNQYLTAIGNYRLILARRFTPGPKLKKRLRPIDKYTKD